MLQTIHLEILERAGSAGISESEREKKSVSPDAAATSKNEYARDAQDDATLEMFSVCLN